ncbi:hypothetical protein F0365_09730 [Nonlabens sp. Ci31]|nr:hypothetical protein F0365_09730 [Nonlabens sp. Ci31]
MIKFFRNIRKNLLNESKMTKYFKYAIGEIVLVVIGILIALQINNWNQNRLEMQEEQIGLNQFYKDFEANDSIIKKGVTFYDKGLKFNTIILKHTGPNVTLPEDKTTRDSPFQFSHPKINLVYGSLNISSQQMCILTDQELKVALSKFPGIYFNYKEVENEIKDLTVKQRLISKKYLSIIAFDPDFDQKNFKSDFMNLLRDREFQTQQLIKSGIAGMHLEN